MNEKFVYWCYISNESGNTWSFGYAPEGEKFGWVWDGNLYANGAREHC
ncbi:hypothetical protein AB0H86_07550 [Streptomyces sp. NPDC050997]